MGILGNGSVCFDKMKEIRLFLPQKRGKPRLRADGAAKRDQYSVVISSAEMP